MNHFPFGRAKCWWEMEEVVVVGGWGVGVCGNIGPLLDIIPVVHGAADRDGHTNHGQTLPRLQLLLC